MKQWFEENMAGNFWTRFDEMIEDLQEYGYQILEANDEYINVEDEVLLYLGHANATIWIDRVCEV